MKPSLWGKHYWFVFHMNAINYPDTPTDEDKKYYIEFYNNYWKFLPCKKCSNNYLHHISQLPVEPNMNNADVLFKWTVDFHNIVNKQLDKPIMTLNDAISFWTTNDVLINAYNNIIYQPCQKQIFIDAMLYINIFFIILIVIFIIWIIYKKKYT